MIALGLFVFVNILMSIIYHSKVLPHYYLGRLDISGKPVSSLPSTDSNQILPQQILLQKDTIQSKQTPANLGVTVDASASVKNVGGWTRWMPALSLITVHHVNLVLHINVYRYDKTAKLVAKVFNYPAKDKHITFNGSDFVIAESHNGYKLNADKLLIATTAALQHGRTTLIVPVVKINAPDSGADLTGQLNQLQKKLDVHVTYTLNGKLTAAGRSEIGKWYVPRGQSLKLSTAAITSYINTLGKKNKVVVANPADMAVASAYAVNSGQSLDLAIVPSNSNMISRTYCTNVDGVSGIVLDSLIGKLAATYNDVRGWNDNGTIAFKHVAVGCQYTVWMTASSQMSSFGSICDDFYNCQVGSNVVLNYNRWTTATPPWNKTGGSIENYRSLMIDHETGHRLGFRDNNTCPSPGLKAPVMMQQSVNLKGCVFNIWPLATELATLNQMLGTGQTSSVTNLQ